MDSIFPLLLYICFTLSGNNSELPKPQSSMVTGFTALANSPLPLRLIPPPSDHLALQHRRAAGGCGYSLGSHSSLRARGRVIEAFEREN